jgi:hypothetical protein
MSTHAYQLCLIFELRCKDIRTNGGTTKKNEKKGLLVDVAGFRILFYFIFGVCATTSQQDLTTLVEKCRRKQEYRSCSVV